MYKVWFLFLQPSDGRKNKKDIDACKLLTKIYINTGDEKQALRFIAAVLKQFGNQGDFYYLAAKVYEKSGSSELYEKNLELAIKSPATLSYSLKALEKELALFRRSQKNAAKAH